MGASTSRRMPTRSRGLSDISNASRGSINAHSNIGHRASFDSKYPSLPKLQRQAPSPLDIPLSQRNDGFVRFLQQHASPPHHRVTAGGRIVPAGPTSPPPMLDYGSLNGLVRERAEAAEASHNKGGSVLSGFKPGNTNSAAMPLNNSHFYLPQGNGTSSQSGYPGNHIQPAIPRENLAYGYQPFMTPTIQSPAAFEPMGNFSDGSACVSCNGIYYRAYLNGMNTIMEPLRSTQLPMEQTDYTGTHLQVPSNVTPYNIPASSPQGPNSYVPLANITNGSWGSNRKTSDNTSTSSSPNKEAELKSQLTDLDKHLALNHFEILPLERAEFVARRRYLVEAIDKIRVANEKAKRSIPIIVPATGLPITPLQMPTFERKDNVSKPPGLRGATSHVQASGKGLSPAAAPFVPSNVRNVRNISSENSTKRTLEEVTNAAIARKDNARNTYDPSGSTQVNSRREVSSSSVLDPSDPAMRVIDHGDIEYAGRYLFNSGFEKKTYCTTVAEFQEAIRQTREQARRHGCLGGSSKDPAYDAEQDIWWAICDRDPIPLPPSVPEYLANPRPWNWQDSIFNMRRKGAPLEGINCDKARNSPRLAGWDPALTEKTKDIIDVSRSYYAFKGMLPSVPFRTWAYDRYGNKVAIESTPDSDTQRGFQSRSISSPVDCTETTTRPKALKSLSKNEINSRDATPRIGSRVKDGRKMHVTEGDSVPRSKSKALDETSPTSRLGMGFERSLTSHVAKNGADDADILKRSKTTSSSYQPYAEDYPETPAKNRSGQQSIEVPTPKAEPVCTSINGTTNSRMSAVETRFLAESSRDPWASSRHLGDMWDSYDSWDPIWMGDYPIDHPKNPIMRERALLSLGEQSAQTKSQWGPEEDSQSLVRFNYPRNQFSEGMPTNKIKTAKVNIPFAGNSHSPLESHHEIHKAKPIISTT